MKKFLSVLLVLTMLFSIAVPALAAGPTPPAWCPAGEYAVFENSTAYTGETWEKLLSLREDAAAGNLAPTSSSNTVLYNRQRELKKSNDPGVRFELGLIDVKYALNAAAQGKTFGVSTNFEFAASYAGDQEDAKYLCYLWNARMSLAARDITTGLEGGLRWYAGAMEYLLPYEQFRFEDIYSHELVQTIPAERLAYAKSLIFVTLDGDLVHPRSMRVSQDYVDYTTAQSRNWRTMVPVRRLAELMGATVEYDAATREITIQRARDTIVLTLDSTTAYQNGAAFQMDVAPYAENNRTYIPIRYIAEFFGQSVVWREEQQHVVITEDKSVAGDSNLEAWALAMSALLNYENNANEAFLFGGKARFGTNPVGSDVSNQLETTGPDFGRYILANSWGIEDRDALFTQTAVLTDRADQAYPAWDLFRVSTLAQWGYLAGYITYVEALELVEPAAKQVARNYSSWDEAYEDYLSGYCRWAGLDTANVWQTERGQLYRTFLSSLMDDSLFTTGVIGLPG